MLILGLVADACSAQYLAEQRTTDPIDALYEAGEKAMRAGDKNTATACFDKVLSMDPDHVNAHLQRGSCHIAQKRYELAIADLSAVIAQRPDISWAYVSRGTAYSKLDQHGAAIADLDKAIELDPTNAEAFNNRGWSKKAMDDPDGACTDWMESKRLGNPEAKIILKNNHCK